MKPTETNNATPPPRSALEPDVWWGADGIDALLWVDPPYASTPTAEPDEPESTLLVEMVA